MDAIGPEHTSAAIVHALTAKRPRTRHVVGQPARTAVRMQWLLPDRAMDWLLERMS